MFFILLLGEWVILSVLSCHSENLKQQTSITARLQLSFIWQAKENTSLKCEGSPAQKTQREEGGSVLAPFSVCFFSSPLSLPYANWASQEAGVFVSPGILTLVRGFSFVPFSRAFPFLCLLAPTIWDSFFLS